MSTDFAGDAAVLHACVRWLERAVIGLTLCPFAKAVYAHGQLRWHVTAARTEPEVLDALRSELQHVAAADPALLDTSVLVLPHALEGFLDFNAMLPRAGALLKRLRLRGVLQIASFHPHYQFADTAADDMANFSNRAPYPMLQVLREDSVERAVNAFPGADMIYQRNIGMLRRLGPQGWAALDVGPAHRDGGAP